MTLWAPGERQEQGSLEDHLEYAKRRLAVLEVVRQELGRLEGHRSQLNGAAFSPDGRRLAPTSEDGSLLVRDVAACEALGSLSLLPAEGEDSQEGWIACCPDGYYHGSPRAARRVRWAIGPELQAGAAWAHTFERPDLVAQRPAAGGNGA